jgi:hypothetical protein
MPKDSYRSSVLMSGSAREAPVSSDQPSLRPVLFVLALFLAAVGAAVGTTSGTSGGRPVVHGHQQVSHVAVLLTDRSAAGH